MGIRKYRFDEKNPKKIPGKLLYISSSRYEEDFNSIQHTHYFVEIFYIRSGKGELIIEDCSYPVQKDDLIIINPNVEHTEISLGTHPLEYIILGVEELQFSFRNQQDFLIFNCRNIKENLLFYFSCMLEEMENQAPGYALICQDLLEILCVYLMRYTQSAFEIVPVRNTSRECSRIKRYIDSNYQDDIRLDALAEMAHLNKYYFVHAFTKYYGLSPINYLIQRRIEVSQDLLSSTDFSLSEIAQQTGFSSPSYFSQCFRKACGMTAKEYRKSSKKQQFDNIQTKEKGEHSYDS